MNVRIGLLSLLGLTFASAATAAPDITFDAPDPQLDRLVDACLAEEGVRILPDTDVICYNSAIYPEQFLQLAQFPETSLIIITSPGGNVATARLMSRILDNRGDPGVIAGQCMSACAMVLLPGLDDVRIHRSAHIAVHGIAMMDFKDWFGWLKGDIAPKSQDTVMANLGYNLDYTMHKGGKSQMEEHLKGQKVDLDYIQTISDNMAKAARKHPCRVATDEYWGMLNAKHLPIAPLVYIFEMTTRAASRVGSGSCQAGSRSFG